MEAGTESNPSVRFLAKSKTFLFLVLTFWQTLICLSKALCKKVRPHMVHGKSWSLSILSEGDITLSSSRNWLNSLLLDKAGKAISSLKKKTRNYRVDIKVWDTLHDLLVKSHFAD